MKRSIEFSLGSALYEIYEFTTVWKRVKHLNNGKNVK